MTVAYLITDHDRHMVGGVLELASLIAVADGSGALHSFVSDGNVEDDDIAFCMAQVNTTPEEQDLCVSALELDEASRAAAWFLARHQSVIPALYAALAKPA